MTHLSHLKYVFYLGPNILIICFILEQIMLMCCHHMLVRFESVSVCVFFRQAISFSRSRSCELKPSSDFELLLCRVRAWQESADILFYQVEQVWAQARRLGPNFRLALNKLPAWGSARLISKEARSRHDIVVSRFYKYTAQAWIRLWNNSYSFGLNTQKARLGLRKVGSLHL